MKSVNKDTHTHIKYQTKNFQYNYKYLYYSKSILQIIQHEIKRQEKNERYRSFKHKFLDLIEFVDWFRLAELDQFELNEIIYWLNYPMDEVLMFLVSEKKETYPR